jgi:uroporphyrin-III C-methyltransferase / precorrin-2 dehydrogenase / sirohydrochlorin ferrochelatase
VSAPTFFPVFLRLAGKNVLLVGGGVVAAAKLPALLETGAVVTVVAPEVREEIAAEPVTVRPRPFRPEDLEDVWFVVAAATPEVNRHVREVAEALHVFVNAVDDPESASAYTGGVLRRGGVTVAVSTEGRAPALAGLLREALDAVLPEEIDAWVRTAAALRVEQRRGGIPMARRRPLLLEALNRLYAEKAAAYDAPVSP